MKRCVLNICICFTALLMITQVKADVVLQADFDSADKIVTTGGKGSLVTYSTNKATVETAPSLAATAGGFLRVDARADSKPGLAGGVTIKPDSADSSLAAMSQIVEGKVVLNGAIEFFFRSSEDPTGGMSVMRVIDVAGSADGLRIVILSHNGKPRIELIGPANTNSFQPTRGKAGRVIAPEIGLVMESQTVYHLAIGFATDDKGLVTMTMYAAEGPVAIDSKNALSTVTFTLDHAAVKSGFSDKPFFFGKSGQAGTPTLQDFDCLRLYNKLPQTFEALK